MLLPVFCFAQQLEVNAAVGGAMHMGAGGNIYFKADKPGVTPVGAARLIFNNYIHTDRRTTWQIGVEGMYYMELRNRSDKKYSYLGIDIGGDGRYFRYATDAVAGMLLGNIKYRFSESAYSYAGLGVGWVQTRNESNRSPDDFKDQPYTYTAPDGGAGPCGGLQLGYCRNITGRLALNAELALRYYSIGYSVSDISYPGGTSFSYGMLAVPVTVGLRYFVGYPPEWRYTWRTYKK